ncbi:hypothetical protein L873DRAFT_1825095 [Choiromyces venosus 120613-1]|uniref:DDE Tnp4 domain-containing protein n=1 Tax=Choiromyces venosus 120613-1 TaxID=1336337 RepID=A0A3N4K5M7_9PEZI|nr:hypothetical protein L873DRAFT_1825095 [Choiromyces venosus 120613-1]
MATKQLQQLQEEEFWNQYRYQAPLLIPVGVPFSLDNFTTTCCPPETALCLLLYRLSAPNQLKEDMKIFQHSQSWLSIVFNDIIDEVIEAKGGVKGIWRFIDGMIHMICRLTLHQRYYYSGYKKSHGFKFQAVITPDGIISCFAGLENHLKEINQGMGSDERCYLYGDPVYALSYGIVSGYKATVGLPLNPVLKEMNAHMSSMRVSVEYGFGKTMNLWAFNGYK